MLISSDQGSAQQRKHLDNLIDRACMHALRVAHACWWSVSSCTLPLLHP